jgi:8-oxo-dGTP diphosphatase
MGTKEQGANHVTGRWLTIPRTLCFVTNGSDVLMMKRGPNTRIFPNRYNGVGGHLERDEDPLTGIRREVLEETGLTVRDIRLRAIYNVDAGEEAGILVFGFTAVSDSRDFQANDEGALHWIPQDQVLALDLVEDLPEMLPRMLEMPPDAPPLFVHLSYDEHDQIQLRFGQ